MDITVSLAHFGYLVSIALFAVGIKRLSKVKTARSANMLAASAMLVAVVSQLLEIGVINVEAVLIGVILGAVIGIFLATKVAMTEMPQLVAVLNGFGGAASVLVAFSLFFSAENTGALSNLIVQGNFGYGTGITLFLSVLIGGVTLSGSIMAYLKLSETWGRKFDSPVLLPGRHAITALVVISVVALGLLWVGSVESPVLSTALGLVILGLTLVLGVLVVIPIGGADMPVVISLLNSYSGLAASATGFALGAYVLIVSGALVGASGLILTHIMCRGMNRSLANVMLGGFGATASGGSAAASEYTNVKSSEADEAALDFDAARDVIIVPGYGLAVAQGQNAIAELATQLKQRGARVRYAIHPVAGRMPGHMNVLLAESSIPYDELFEMDEINSEFSSADIVLVVGANDVVNPSAKDDQSSPLYGMPVLNVEAAKIVYVIKRSLSPGFAGVKNVLFEYENCRMIFGDAKKVLEDITAELELEMAA